MRGLPVLLFALSACTVAPPGPAVHQELILDITNNRNAPVVLRIVPQILGGVGLPGLPPAQDEGGGDGSQQVEPHRQQTVHLSITSPQWTLTVNGRPFLRSTDHEFIPGGSTSGRIVVGPGEMTSELGVSQPAPSD